MGTDPRDRSVTPRQEKEAFEAPVLKPFGTLQHLTAGQGGIRADGGSGMTMA